MNGWYSISLGDAMLADPMLDTITAIFESEYLQSGKPATMAMFTRHESEGRLHCELKVFFTPAAASVAGAFQAVPCASPKKSGLDLRAGAAAAWSLLAD